MPYKLRRRDGKVEIVRQADGKVVGRSDNYIKAKASIKHRLSGEKKQNEKKK